MSDPSCITDKSVCVSFERMGYFPYKVLAQCVEERGGRTPLEDRTKFVRKTMSNIFRCPMMGNGTSLKSVYVPPPPPRTMGTRFPEPEGSKKQDEIQSAHIFILENIAV